MFDYFLLLIGLVLLLIGGDWLVRGSVGLAEKLKVPPLIIGLTIVSFGTSAPELFVSVNSALSGADGIAIGNIVGSNIANVLMVLGIPAIFWAMKCDEKGIGRSILVMIGVTVLFIGMMQKGALSRFDGFVLIVILGLFLIEQFRSARKARKATEEKFDYNDEVDNIPASYYNIMIALLIGMFCLAVGSELTVNAAIMIAGYWGIAEEIIGLTVVAVGTSLPELVTTLMAVRRKNSSIALGNIVGSNILNIALIMGVTSLIQPIIVTAHIYEFDVWIMLASSILLGLLAYWKINISRTIGLVMAIGYATYVSTTVLFIL
ncbi:MAG: calcium/sodium antiporter [Rhizobiaceae bacterium]|nr:calcium/sodium antiporter [Rhizobiaceae bacterium]